MLIAAKFGSSSGFSTMKRSSTAQVLFKVVPCAAQWPGQAPSTFA